MTNVNATVRRAQTALDMLLTGAVAKIGDEFESTRHNPQYDQAISTLFASLMRELEDWDVFNHGGNNAMSPDQIAVSLNGPRTPFNLGSAGLSIGRELLDLNGAEALRSMIEGLQGQLAEAEARDRKRRPVTAKASELREAGTLIATFALHPDSPVGEAIGVAAPFGMQVLEFRPGWVKYSAPNREAITGLAADLSIEPTTVEMA